MPLIEICEEHFNVDVSTLPGVGVDWARIRDQLNGIKPFKPLDFLGY